MRYRVFRQGTSKSPKICPKTDEPWDFVGEVEADDRKDAIAKTCGDEPPCYNRVWYIAIAQNPEYWRDENGEHGKPYIRPW